jgi:hypothetical protein
VRASGFIRIADSPGVRRPKTGKNRDGIFSRHGKFSCSAGHTQSAEIFAFLAGRLCSNVFVEDMFLVSSIW